MLLTVLCNEIKQRLLAQAVKKHRLMVLNDSDTAEHTLRVHPDQQADRLAREALKTGVIIGLKGIAKQLVKLINTVNRRVFLLGFDAGSFGKQCLDLAVIDCCGCGLADQQPEQAKGT